MIEDVFNGISLKFLTDNGVFSPNRLDAGTKLMLSAADLGPGDKALDLGCGYGFVGVYLKKKFGCEVFMSDSDAACVQLSRENLALNGAEGVEVIHSDAFRNISVSGFNAIFSNPPYHADFSVAREFIEKGFNRLVIGGRMYMVTRRLDWYKNKLIAIFGGVKIIRAGGYFVFVAEKRQSAYFK